MRRGGGESQSRLTLKMGREERKKKKKEEKRKRKERSWRDRSSWSDLRESYSPNRISWQKRRRQMRR